jgi:hypothetical protein
MAAIAAQLPAEARERHEPTEEELVRTYPKGKVGEERVVGVSASPSSRPPSESGPEATPPAGRTTATKKAAASKKPPAKATAPKPPAPARRAKTTTTTTAPGRASRTQQPARTPATRRPR